MKRHLSVVFIALGILAHGTMAAEPTIKRENIEWTQIWVPDLHKNDLPRVLLIGDSICDAYYDEVAKELQGKAYVAKLATSSSLGDPALLDQVKLLLDNYNFAVIHFNNGLHGFDYTEEEYGNDIPKFLKLVKKFAPDSKLIWATSTPMRDKTNLQEINPKTKRVVARNQIVVDIAEKEGIPVDDLYSLVIDHPEYWSNDGVHFKPEGQAVEGRQVAKYVLDILSE